VWFVRSGGLQLITARRLRGLPGAGIALFNGVVSIVLAVLIVADLPSSAAWALCVSRATFPRVVGLPRLVGGCAWRLHRDESIGMQS
jgi:uncharacterized membrane protein HdeD (DUF308 family)